MAKKKQAATKKKAENKSLQKTVIIFVPDAVANLSGGVSQTIATLNELWAVPFGVTDIYVYPISQLPK
ncbi:MAG TPA: hypothetical protein VEI07_09630 [Planctomycetaceae bacterium]|nr:hypothetical protein [Planctomycetaceae bacterium]